MINSIKNFSRKIHIGCLRTKAKECGILPTESLRRVMIVAPHPDDEVIGCGGMIARLVAEGRAPHVIIMTGGEGAHRGCCHISEADIIKSRRRLTRNALAILGVPEENIHELDFPDGGISEGCDQMVILSELIERLNPDTVFVPHWGEGWSDHVKTAEIVKKLVPEATTVWEYCVWMWYYNVFRGLDWKNAAVLQMISQEHSLKLRAMDAYISPLAPCGHPWSGVLPPLFVKANQWNKELYFRVR